MSYYAHNLFIFKIFLVFSVERFRLRLKQKKTNPSVFRKYASRSELWANSRMTICSFDTPIFNVESGTVYNFYQIAPSMMFYNKPQNFSHLNLSKQHPHKMPTNCLSVFDHFVGLALKGIISVLFVWKVAILTQGRKYTGFIWGKCPDYVCQCVKLVV